MDTTKVPGAVATVLFNRKLSLGDRPPPENLRDPPLCVQFPSPQGVWPICHPKGGPPLPLKTLVTEHWETGLHWYWDTNACCQKLALAFCSCMRNPHSRLVAPPWKLPRL